MTKAKLYRIWHFDTNDRHEIARIKAYDFDTVQQFLLHTFIKPEFQSEIELTDYGLEWSECDPKECLENTELCEKCINRDEETFLENLCQLKNPRTINEKCLDFELDKDYNPCEQCDEPDYRGFQIDEIEKPNGKSWGENLEDAKKANDEQYIKIYEGKIQQWYNDLEQRTKAQNHDPFVAKAWRQDPQLGISALLLSSMTPQEALSPELKKKALYN